MTIKLTKYVIGTKDQPMMFEDNISHGYMTNHIEYAVLYNSEENALNEIDDFDEPEKYKPLKVNVTYEI